jgi:hypothetical protein
MRGKYIVLYFGPYAAWEFTSEERGAIPDAAWAAVFDDPTEPQPLTLNIGLSGGGTPSGTAGPSVGIVGCPGSTAPALRSARCDSNGT